MYCLYQDREELEDDLYQEQDGDSEGSEVNSELEFNLYSQLHYSSNALELEEEEGEKESRDENTAGQGSEKAPDAGRKQELPSPDISEVQEHLMMMKKKKNKKSKEEEETRDKQTKKKSDPERRRSSASSRFEEVIVIDSSPDVISLSGDDTADDEGICSLKGRSKHRLQTSTPAQQRAQKKTRSLSEPVTVDSSSSDSSFDFDSSEESPSESSDSDGLENWMILGRGKQNEDQSISLNLEGGSDGNTDAGEEEGHGSWLVSDKDKDAQIFNKDKGARPVLQRVTNRYYTAKNVQCRNCNKTGHLSKNCPEPKKLSSCFLCGTTGHLVRDCPDRHCNNCGLPGHMSASCIERAYWHKQCHRCGVKGHFFDECPEIWRQYHITTKPGPLVVQRGEDNGRSPAFCYNCSKRGHFGHACTRPRMFNGVYAAVPFIGHYDTVKDVNRREHRLKQKVKELKNNGCFSNTFLTPVTPEPPKKKQKLNHRKSNHTPHHQTSQNHKPSRSHIIFNDDDFTIPETNKSSKCKRQQQQQSTSNVKPWKPKRPVPTSRDPPTKLILDEADDFPRGGGKGQGIISKKKMMKKNKMKTREEPKGRKKDRRPDQLYGEKRKKKKRTRGSDKKHAESMYPTDENLFLIKQRKRSR